MKSAASMCETCNRGYDIARCSSNTQILRNMHPCNQSATRKHSGEIWTTCNGGQFTITVCYMAWHGMCRNATASCLDLTPSLGWRVVIIVSLCNCNSNGDSINGTAEELKGGYRQADVSRSAPTLRAIAILWYLVLYTILYILNRRPPSLLYPLNVQWLIV